MNLNSVLIGSEDPKRLAEYYTKIFGKPSMEDSGYTGWKVGDGWITVGPHSEIKGKNPQPGRMLLNIESPDVEGDFAKLAAAGARSCASPTAFSEDPILGHWLMGGQDRGDRARRFRHFMGAYAAGASFRDHAEIHMTADDTASAVWLRPPGHFSQPVTEQLRMLPVLLGLFGLGTPLHSDS